MGLRRPRANMKSLRRWLGLWWISWFGIIGGFLMVGIGAQRHESTVASRFSIALMIVTVVLWISFFIADHHARERIDGEANRRVVVDLLTLTGTFLAVFTLLGISFFVVIAPRVR
jgi:RsiW-degrading membrane proteinase PrsW (M82 family)